MAIISAFVGRGFDKKHDLVWMPISKYLDSLKQVGFAWEDAEEAQAKPISDKVKERIERNDLFIGILTKGEPITAGHLSLMKKYILLEKILNWLASYWIIQESGYAIGRGKKVIFLIEKDLEIPGGLNSDFEYIPLDTTNLSGTFLKVNQIIASEIATRSVRSEELVATKGTELIPVQKPEIEKQKEVEEDETNFKTVMEKIDSKDFPAAEEQIKIFLNLDKIKTKPSLHLWAETFFYRKLYEGGKAEAIEKLEEIADENSTKLGPIEALVECYLFYDQHDEAIKTIESFLKPESDFNFKFQLSMRLSEIELKRKKFDLARERLTYLFNTLESNTSHQNYLIYKLLGDIYKEQGEENTASFLYELALNYQPTDSELRFKLAHGYGTINQNALSIYHYKTYLTTNRWTGALNNLGIEYESLGLIGKSVSVLNEAELEGETLATSNLARMHIEKGFYDEAEKILTGAFQKEGHNKNVEYYLNKLRGAKEAEEEKERLFLAGAIDCKNFILELAKAISIPFYKYEEINGLWATNYEELQEFRVEYQAPGKLIGEHEQEIHAPLGLIALALKQESEKRRKKIHFAGKITNRGITFSIKISTYGGTFLTQTTSEFSGYAIFLLESQEIKFWVQKEEKGDFFTARKLG